MIMEFLIGIGSLNNNTAIVRIKCYIDFIINF